MSSLQRESPATGGNLHIHETVEVEAMPAHIRRALLRERIEALLPADALQIAKVVEHSERELLLNLAEHTKGAP